MSRITSKTLNQLIFGLLACIGLSSHAASINEISQAALLDVDKTQHIIVDVRTAREYSEGHVPGAINIPLSKIQKDATRLNLDKNKTVVLYCRSGYRAAKAADILLDNGFEHLLHLEGDMLGWSKAGLTTEN
ncbi:rhodanese-like domain-containing protein [Paraglaciecola aquimarina]|uniref:Rhodanese-like domain-containing protein n=1 Tax=Paraglaciecola aquimarina TaxID=1235557 RepID=A0ABU3SS82_9ALTE|nr:rhodanese-like domain-containing protein [Paraglaciecola aquimarina]MDU0352880.1 rhodanese-like domain-containing protein [Paraglaciecola aquimarina]